MEFPPVVRIYEGVFRPLGTRLRNGNRVVGLDLSEPMLRVAARKGSPVVGGSAQALLFQDASFAGLRL